jgi:hypothetical protein
MENKAIDAMVKKLDILYDKIFYFRDVIDCTNKEPKDWCTATEIQIYE